jgi:uncharacterized RDD family membrane protein YckC
MKYYLIENEEQTGPFTIEELKEKGIHKSTLVWTKGIDDWTEAKHIPMLKDIIEETPPEYVKPQKEQKLPPIPPTTDKEIAQYFGYTLATRRERFIAMLVFTLIFFIPIGLTLLATMPDSYFYDDGLSIWDILMDGIIGMILGAIFYPLWSGNLGHKLFGLKVISKETGEDINSPITGGLRELLKNILGHLIIPIIWLLWDKDKQNLYDKIVKTIVVKKKVG